jgi:hypothetical protein
MSITPPDLVYNGPQNPPNERSATLRWVRVDQNSDEHRRYYQCAHDSFDIYYTYRLSVGPHAYQLHIQTTERWLDWTLEQTAEAKVNIVMNNGDQTVMTFVTHIEELGGQSFRLEGEIEVDCMLEDAKIWAESYLTPLEIFAAQINKATAPSP